MHLGRPGSTKGPYFTIKDYMHRVRHVTYTIKIISHTETQDKYTCIRYINIYATNRISIHLLFIIIILYFEYINPVHP